MHPVALPSWVADAVLDSDTDTNSSTRVIDPSTAASPKSSYASVSMSVSFPGPAEYGVQSCQISPASARPATPVSGIAKGTSLPRLLPPPNRFVTM